MHEYTYIIMGQQALYFLFEKGSMFLMFATFNANMHTLATALRNHLLCGGIY